MTDNIEEQTQWLLYKLSKCHIKIEAHVPDESVLSTSYTFAFWIDTLGRH